MMSVVGDGIGTRARASYESERVYKDRWIYSTQMKREKLRGGRDKDSEDAEIREEIREEGEG